MRRGLDPQWAPSPASHPPHSPLAVVEVTAVARVALHLQLALAIQGVTSDLQTERPCQFSRTCPPSFSPQSGQGCLLESQNPATVPSSVRQLTFMSACFLSSPSPPFPRPGTAGPCPTGGVRRPGSALPGDPCNNSCWTRRGFRVPCLQAETPPGEDLSRWGPPPRWGFLQAGTPPG